MGYLSNYKLIFIKIYYYSLGNNCIIQLTRTYSVPDLSTYYSERYRPQWHSVWQTTPYRWRKDWEWYDDYWYNRHYMYYTPLYSTYFPKSRYYYSLDHSLLVLPILGKEHDALPIKSSSLLIPMLNAPNNRSYLRDSSLNPTDRGLGMHKAGRYLWHY
ncbi:hypothetical protein WR25_03110 [Diploscapter pachys]|uniref:Uncharacterized protein n=1 Tax=Diploscapter pachys TaxID=2018661 RepID=A0A2A2JFZ1_9BILA|nr:hypothetical protein WR25_03110 [Diploscapter pachys]